MQNLSADQLRVLFSETQHLICVLSPDKTVVAMNGRWLKIFGDSYESWIGQPFANVVCDADRNLCLDHLTHHNDISSKMKPIELRVVDKNHFFHWYRWYGFRHDGQFFLTGSEIADLKAEESLNDEIQRSGLIGGWYLDLEQNKTTWTSQTYRIHDLPVGAALTVEGCIDYYHPADQEKLKSCIDRCLKTGASWDEDLRIKTALGRNIWVRAMGHRACENTRDVQLMRGTLQDITERKHAELKHKERSVHLERIIRNTPGMVYQLRRSTEGTLSFPFVSDQAYEIFGVTAQEMQSHPERFVDSFHVDDRESLMAAIEVSAQVVSPFSWSGRTTIGPNGLRWIKASSVPEKQADGAIVWDGVLIDLTHEHELNEQLENQRRVTLHTARLADIGQLAAGVGHEINNPLAIAMGKVDSITSQLKDLKFNDAHIDKCLSQVQQSHQRIRKIVDGLRTFARAGSTNSSRGRLVSATMSTVGLVAELYKKEGVDVIGSWPEELEIYVQCDEARIQQVVMNLLSNARDATEGRDLRRVEVSVSTGQNQSATIKVSDNGCGMTEAVRRRIFESFFTTKPAGQGTGLGLSITHSIVQATHGTIDVQSVVNEGTTFCVSFPLAAEQTETSSQEVSRTTQMDAQSLSALVVDDEPDLREILSDYLREHHFKVMVAENGRQAMELLGSQQFDFLFTDAMMPIMDGLTLLTRASQQGLLRNTWTILVSGGVLEDYQKKIKDISGSSTICDGFLPKPFDHGQLVQLITDLRSRQKAVQSA